MSKNPFSEPGDEAEENERTVIRPVPGGRRSAPPAKRPTPAPAAVENEATASAGTPLVAAAAPLLQLLARLRNAAHQPDAGDLYERTTRALSAFEQRAREAGVPAEQLRPASYALCASIDDAVLNTPWGAASVWAQRRLAATFHPDVTGDGRFFDALARMGQNPAKFMPVIEVMYLCLSLGFMGRYRQAPQGAGELDRLCAATCALIAGQDKAAATELSQRWQGIAAPYRPSRGGLPIWVAYAAALAVCGGLFVWVSTALNAASDEQYARMLAASPGRMPQITRAAVVQPPPPPPAPPEPDTIDRLRSALGSDIEAGIVSVVGTPTTPIVRVGTHGGFTASGAVLAPTLAAVLGRIGTALSTEPGSVQVIGYTDNQPIRTVQFPSNFQLSAARAQAARAAIARTIGDAKRLSAEGRADADPIASNATAEGREQNRRLEIVLHRQE
jgi:type VI secretion system protein ImpK